MHNDNSNDRSVEPATQADTPHGAEDGRLTETLASALQQLHRGGSLCVKVRGTFPQQFICAGTSDQIERLLREPDL